MEKAKRNLLKLNIINERFLTSVLKILSADTVLSKKLLGNIEYLLEVIDTKFYSKDLNVYALIQAIGIAVKRRQTIPIYNAEDMISEIEVMISPTYDKQKKDIIIPTIKIGKTLKNPTETTFVNSSIETHLKYSAIILTKEKMLESLTDITSGNPNNLEESISKYRNTLESVTDEFRKTDSVINNDIINSVDEDFIDILMETYDDVKNPKFTLKTGLKTFNKLLSEEGGFKSSCYYIFYASINSFKSGILQYCMKWIRKYNWDNYQKMFNETGKIPTILFYSFENTRNENMQREFYMETGTQLKDINSKQEAKLLWDKNYNSTGSMINVAYVYAESNSVRVSDMRRQIHSMNENGYKVIAVIADYLELIRPEDEDSRLENRLKLGYISNAFHVMCVSEDITGITAQQMNRAAETTMSDLRNKGQSNIIEQMGGMQFIGESYAIEKPADVSAYIGTERSIYDNKLYLTIKRGKCRYRRTPVNYFVQELHNGFYIEDDLLKDEITSKSAIMPTVDKEIKEIDESVKKEFDKPIGERGSRTIRDSKVEKKKKLTEEDTSNIIEDILGKKK
ncbi:MAG: DnaB family ATPase [Anaeroplasmataceae bacterium]